MTTKRTSAEKRRAPWFKLWAQEWLTNERTNGWSVERKGALLQLRCWAWLAEDPCSLPNDGKQLAHLSGLGSRWKHHESELLAWFEPHGDRLRDRELHELFQQMVTEGAARSERAREAAISRWGMATASAGVAHADAASEQNDDTDRPSRTSGVTR